MSMFPRDNPTTGISAKPCERNGFGHAWRSEQVTIPDGNKLSHIWSILDSKILMYLRLSMLVKKFKAFENIIKISAHSFMSTANDASGHFLSKLTNYTHPENISTVKVVGKTMSDHWRLVREDDVLIKDFWQNMEGYDTVYDSNIILVLVTLAMKSFM